MLDILVTGAAGGIGQTTVKLFLDRGHRVFATDRVEIDTGVATNTGRLVPLILDVTDQASIDRARQKIADHTDGLDALVNNAGWFDQFPLVEGSMERFEQIVLVNVMASQRMVRTFFSMLYRRKGRVINVSSESALALMPLQAYGMTKKMLDAYTEVLRQELALLDMQVITIRPGAHLTPFIQRSVDVLESVDNRSLYAGALENVRKEGTKILRKVTRDPKAVAETIFKATVAPSASREYWVNVSLSFRVLRLLPRAWRDRLFRIILSRRN